MRISDWSSDVCSSDLGGPGQSECGRLCRLPGHAADVRRHTRHRRRRAAAREPAALPRRQLLHRPTGRLSATELMHGTGTALPDFPARAECTDATALAPSLCLRPATEADLPFLRELYAGTRTAELDRSAEQTSELQSLMRISYAVFCLKKKTLTTHQK